MVAIAVVGGILIFVFTQGFFADEQVVGPTVDNIRIFGYSASDEEDTIQEATSGAGTLVCNQGTVDNALNEDDCVTIFIENLGDKPVAIQAVRMFGLTYTDGDGSSGTCPGNPSLTAGFDMYDTSSNLISILEPNTQATLCVSFTGNDVKPGRTIPIQVETANGQSSQINIINGAVRGQQ